METGFDQVVVVVEPVWLKRMKGCSWEVTVTHAYPAWPSELDANV
jgi:hypothetical protein